MEAIDAYSPVASNPAPPPPEAEAAAAQKTQQQSPPPPPSEPVADPNVGQVVDEYA